MRICIVTETFAPEVNGVAMTIGRMVDGLIELGHQVQLVRPAQSADDVGTPRARFEEVLVHGVPLPMYDHLRFGLIRPGRLARCWRSWAPDLVHVVTEGPLGLAAVTAAEKMSLPVSSGYHTNFQAYTNHYGFGMLQGVAERYLRWLHNRTDATFVPTNALAQQLEHQGYDNTVVVSRGVDCRLFSPQRRDATLRAQWGAGPDTPVMLYVGRLAAEKNVELVLRSFAAAKTQQPAIRLVLVGDGPLRAQLQQQCPEALFAGVRKGVDLARHYASADIFVFPSLTETFGNVTSEALASGLAVAAYEHAAAGELIVDGENGRIARVGDEDAFLQAVLGLVQDAELRASIKDAAASSVAHLDWAQVHQRVADLMTLITRNNRLPESSESLQQTLACTDDLSFLNQRGTR